MNGSNYWAWDFVQAIVDHWWQILLGWFLLSCLVGPLLGRWLHNTSKHYPSYDGWANQQWVL